MIHTPGNQRADVVTDLVGDAQIEYLFKMLKRHSGLPDANSLLELRSTETGPTLFYQNRKILVSQLQERICLPLDLGFMGKRDDLTNQVVTAVSTLRGKQYPFCTYDYPLKSLNGQETMPIFVWARNPKDTREIATHLSELRKRKEYVENMVEYPFK